MNLLSNISSVKTAIKNSNNVQHWNQFLDIVSKIEKSNERVIIEKIFENNFIIWLFKRMEEIVEKCPISELDELRYIIAFLTTCADSSSYFCEKVTENETLLTIVKSMIKEKLTQLHEDSEINIVFLINNVTYQIQKQYFNDLDIKTFLIEQVKTNSTFACIMTLMRLFTETEIMQFKDIICSTVPYMVEIFKQCCESHNNRFEGYGLNELVKNIAVLCKCNKAKEMLKSNFLLLFNLRLIFVNSKFIAHRKCAEDLISLLYTPEQITQFKDEILNSEPKPSFLSKLVKRFR